MCGICGAVQLGGEPRRVLEPGVLDWMTDVMAHRGPNDRGTYCAPGVELGVRRLSIVDVEGGHQPFVSEDRAVWAVQNGELYNHIELRAELAAKGHRFRTRCDTEILPHLYEDDGSAGIERLRGKFGLAIWDSQRRRLVLARDRLGVKPLYFAQVRDVLVFASELKSLLASGLVGDQLDYEAIDAFLTLGYFPGPDTPLAGVSKLRPGHILSADERGVVIRPYWTYPPPAPDAVSRTADEYADGLLLELEEAVRLRLMSDVPLGAMLSGGLDSSLVVALMARNMSEPVKTFSIGFREEENELADARLVASAFGTDHHELELSFEDAAVDLTELAWHLDEPLAELSALGFLAISQLAAQHVTVALSGQGADELLGGYRKHQAASLVGAWQRLPRLVRRPTHAAARVAPRRFRRAARTLIAPDPVSRLLAMSGQLDDNLRSALVRGPLLDVTGTAAARGVSRCLDGVVDDPLPVTLFLDAQLALVDNMLHYFDRASMAHSLEVRVPFLDHRVVEYCATIPSSLKVRHLRTKHVLRQAARGIIPDEIIDKPKVGFFRQTAGGWLRAQLDRAVTEHLLQPNAAYSEFIDRRTVEALIHEHASPGGRNEHAQLLLSLISLEVWLTSFLPRARGGPPAHLLTATT